MERDNHVSRRNVLKHVGIAATSAAVTTSHASAHETSTNYADSDGTEGDTWKISDNHGHDLFVEGDGSGGRVYYGAGAALRQRGAYWDDANHSVWEAQFHLDTQFKSKYRTSDSQDPADAIDYEGIGAHEVQLWHDYGDYAECDLWLNYKDSKRLVGEPHPQYTKPELAEDVFIMVADTALGSLSALVGTVRQAGTVYEKVTNAFDDQSVNDEVSYTFAWDYGTGTNSDLRSEASHYIDWKFTLPDGRQMDHYVESWVHNLFQDDKMGIIFNIIVTTPSYNPNIQSVTSGNKLDAFSTEQIDRFNLEEISITEARRRGLEVDENRIVGDTVVYTPGLPWRVERVPESKLQNFQNRPELSIKPPQNGSSTERE